MKRLLMIVALSAALSSCAMTLPVKGQSESGEELFSGKATGGIDGSGTLNITSTKGRSCQGSFVYTTQRRGEGTFTCTNGQSGAFSFVSTGTKGTGTGTIGGTKFTFTFG